MAISRLRRAMEPLNEMRPRRGAYHRDICQRQRLASQSRSCTAGLARESTSVRADHLMPPPGSTCGPRFAGRNCGTASVCMTMSTGSSTRRLRRSNQSLPGQSAVPAAPISLVPCCANEHRALCWTRSAHVTTARQRRGATAFECGGARNPTNTTLSAARTAPRLRCGMTEPPVIAAESGHGSAQSLTGARAAAAWLPASPERSLLARLGATGSAGG